MSTPSQASLRQYRYLDVVTAGFVTVLLCADLIGPAKISRLDIPQIGSVTFGAGVIFFPVSYLFGDILTEVYGYAQARKVVWTGFAALLFASFMSWVVVILPPAPDWGNQQAYNTVFGQVPRIVVASLLGFWAGEFTNSYVLAKMKVLSAGRWLWTRTITSTIVGEIVDSVIFYTLAFAGLWTSDQILRVMISNYLIKCGWEILATPATYKIVNWLKRVEHEDYFDRHTDFNPFHFDQKPRPEN